MTQTEPMQPTAVQWSEWKSKFDEWLKADGPIAIAAVQYLEPALGKDAVIFPPTYPMQVLRGRTHTVKDGDYRVSVELPPFRESAGKSEDKSEQKAAKEPGYNIDYLRSGSNICEIDSPQSQANRMEPLFKTLQGGKLVPQVVISVKGEPVNLLDAGHRGADALVVFSSLCEEFNAAFADAKRGNFLKLARISPTSLLYGAWDSRGTQAKLPRIIKAQIRATNVDVVTRSAQFVPAADFIGSGAIDEELNKGGDDKNPLSAEGFNAIPATRMHGGVVVRGEIKREVLINLAALRGLLATEESLDGATGEIVTHDRSGSLQRYLFALALVCLARPPVANLREGCLLRSPRPKDNKLELIPFEGENKPFPKVSAADAEMIALAAAEEFFGGSFGSKDRPNGVFESGVADKYLRMEKADREAIRRAGAITQRAIDVHLARKSSDPFNAFNDILKQLTAPKKKTGKAAVQEVVPNFFDTAVRSLKVISSEDDLTDSVSDVVARLVELLESDSDTNATLKEAKDRLKKFKESQKLGVAENAASAADPQPPA